MIRQALLLGFAVFWAAITYCEWKSPVIRSLIQKRPVELAVLGLDEVEHTSRADSILILRLEPGAPAIKILQIPRDISWGADKRVKINAVISRAGLVDLKKMLSQILPGWNLNPQRAAVFRFDAFLQTAQSLGPVSWNGETLGPEESLDLVRSRSAWGDWGRLNTQKSYLATLARTIADEPWRLAAFFAQWTKISSKIVTDLSAFELAGILARARPWGHGANVFFYQAPTSLNARGNLNIETQAADELAAWWQGDPNAPFDRPGRPATLEVLNASSEPGLAMKMTRALRKNFNDLDILYFGASSMPQNTSFLILRRGGLRLAKQTQVRLNKNAGLELVQWVAPSRSKGVDFTLVLGEGAGAARIVQNIQALDNF